MILAAPCGASRSKNSDSPSNFPPQPTLFLSSKFLFMRDQINSKDSRAEKFFLISAKESQRSITSTPMSFIVKFLSNLQGIKVWKFERYHTSYMIYSGLLEIRTRICCPYFSDKCSIYSGRLIGVKLTHHPSRI